MFVKIGVFNSFILSFFVLTSNCIDENFSEIDSELIVVRKRDINPCKYLQCINDGKCISFNNLAQCQCPEGFRGMRCEINDLVQSQNCSNMICQNGGKCIQYSSSGAICFCRRPYVGKYCEALAGATTTTTTTTTTKQIVLRKKDACDYIKCPNGSKCKLTSYNLATCVYDQSAKIETSNIRPYIINRKKLSFCLIDDKPRCKNRGKCIQKSQNEGYCICLPSFTGPKCEYKLNSFEKCDLNPCPPNNKCVSYNGQFICFK